MASHHTDSHGLFLLSHGESRRVFLSRIIELSNFSSHGESRTVTEDFFVTNLRISEFFFTRRIADGHGEFICHEFANCSSHGWLRTVTEDFYGMRPLLWTYCTTGRNLRINTHTDGHGESFCPEFANLRIFLHTENCGRSRRIYLSRICELFFTRMVADGHGGFLWYETFTLDILNNGKEFAN